MGSKENLSLMYRDFSKHFQADMAKERNVLEKNCEAQKKPESHRENYLNCLRISTFI